MGHISANCQQRPLPSLWLTEDVHEMVEVLTAALDAKHAYTCGHSDRVATISIMIAKHMELSKQVQDFIHVAGHLHDVGKIGVPDNILLKPGKLTVDEYTVMKTHSETGYEMLFKVTSLKPVAHIVRHHHERWDGQGYPLGLKGENIPLASRIIAVADAYDAMISKRPYRPSMNHKEAVLELLRCKGSQFDPRVIGVFEKLTCDEGVMVDCNNLPPVNLGQRDIGI